MLEANYVVLPDSVNDNERAGLILSQINALIMGEDDFIANCANVCSLLYFSLGNVSWCGFYLWKNNELVLGPFHGKPACTRIQSHQGVCGMVTRTRQTLIVPDVEQFEGHIACDAQTRSEIVVPVLQAQTLIGVLDVDSAQTDRFHAEDARLLESVVRMIPAPFSSHLTE